jgi:hypothetical protein
VPESAFLLKGTIDDVTGASKDAKKDEKDSDSSEGDES